MSTTPSPPPAVEVPAEAEVAEGSKKRKRTGKAREERKKAAIQAQLELEIQAQQAKKVQLATAIEENTTAHEDNEASASKETAFARPEVDVEQAAKRIPQALKSLHPIFKQVKTFETRRLIKKIKFLRTKPDTDKERTDLEAQLQLIGHIQLHPLAQSHLNAKLRKHPLLKHSPLPPSLANALTPTTEPSPSTSATTSLVGKVENRLCSAKTVADAVKSVVAWIVGEQGAKLILGGAAAKKVPVEKKVGMNPARAARIAAGDDDDDDDDDDDVSISDDGEEDMVPRMIVEGASDLEIGSDDEDVQENYAADAAGWESGSLSGGEGSDDGQDSDSDAISLPPASRRKLGQLTQEAENSQKVKVKAKTGKEEITSSTFLPSLSVGFTRGDEGDSDPDLDYDPDGVIGTKKAERKNRRGQRARQAIWEKKYGKGAKHVVKARQEEQAQKEKVSKAREERELAKKLGRDSGWGAKAKSSSTSSTTTATVSKPAPAPAFTSFSAPAPALSVGAEATTNSGAEKKLHPSWEAARLRKQKMGMAAVPAQSAKSNKIVFD